MIIYQFHPLPIIWEQVRSVGFNPEYLNKSPIFSTSIMPRPCLSAKLKISCKFMVESVEDDDILIFKSEITELHVL